MAEKIKVVITPANRAEIIQMLKSADLVEAALRPSAERIKTRADSALQEPGHEITTLVSKDRASLLIRTASFAAMEEETKNRNLTKSIEAGRG